MPDDDSHLSGHERRELRRQERRDARVEWPEPQPDPEEEPGEDLGTHLLPTLHRLRTMTPEQRRDIVERVRDWEGPLVESFRRRVESL